MTTTNARTATLVLAAATLLAVGAPPLVAQGVPAGADLDAAIHDYIVRHPKVIKEALEKATADEQADQTRSVLRDHKADLYDAAALSFGPADAKVTIVEFFDYNCPFCRKVHPQLKAFLAKHPDTRLVMRDIAIFGKDSEGVAKIALAAASQGKAADFTEALLTAKGKANEASALDAARKLGLDVERLKSDAAAPETAKRLADARKLADAMAVNGTPLFIIGHNGIPGAPPDLMDLIEKYTAEVRSNGCDVC